MVIRKCPWQRTERQKWATPIMLARARRQLGLSGLDEDTRRLYGELLPRGVMAPRLMPDRPPLNYWMEPQMLADMTWRPGEIILGKIGGSFIGYLDDRPIVTIAGARAGKSSTVLLPNLYLYPGSMLVLDNKGELAAATAEIRRAQGHRVIVLDPFGASKLLSSSYNPLADLDPESNTIVDDAAAVAQSIVEEIAEGNGKHFTDGARALTQGIVLFTLTLPEEMGQDLVTVRELLTLTHPHLLAAVRTARLNREAEARAAAEASGAPMPKPMGKAEERRLAMSTLLNAMVKNGNKDFGPVLTGIGKRFLATPEGERGSIFSTAAVNTDFMDSIPMRGISRSSDFSLADLRSGQPTTVYLCIPEGRLGSHYRWLRMIVQLACLVLEEMGPAPRDGRPPVLLMLDEFASLGRMPVMERAAAYLPGFGVKLWAALQDIKQLHPYGDAAETFLGNAGLVQCWANTDPATVEYIANRLDKLMMPFEVAQTFARENNNQLLMFAGKQPAAAMRLSHDDVAEVKERSTELAWALERERSKGRR